MWLCYVLRMDPCYVLRMDRQSWKIWPREKCYIHHFKKSTKIKFTFWLLEEKYFKRKVRRGPSKGSLSIYICLSVCLSVRFYPIIVKTAEPIWPKFCVGPHVTPGKVCKWSKFQKLVSRIISFSLNFENHEIFFLNPQTFLFVFVKQCIKRENVHNWKRRWASVCLYDCFQCTLKPIGPKLFCRNSHDPGKGLWMLRNSKKI